MIKLRDELLGKVVEEEEPGEKPVEESEGESESESEPELEPELEPRHLRIRSARATAKEGQSSQVTKMLKVF